MCLCDSPDTPIATPTGDRSIASLQPGETVYGVHAGQVVEARILRTRVALVPTGHRMVRVQLANGATLEVSPTHPTLDGRTFGDLRPGGVVGGVAIVDVGTVAYAHDRTYDILVDTDSGGYFAGGALVGSTLQPRARVDY
jgi:hypothetical protein